VTPIIPVILGEPERAVRAGAELERRGFAVGVIRPPTVPRGTARLRISMSSVHDIETVDRLADAIIEVCRP
jgi:8-amino-7-oxononanoate synthase